MSWDTRDYRILYMQSTYGFVELLTTGMSFTINNMNILKLLYRWDTCYLHRFYSKPHMSWDTCDYPILYMQSTYGFVELLATGMFFTALIRFSSQGWYPGQL